MFLRQFKLGFYDLDNRNEFSLVYFNIYFMKKFTFICEEYF